jgi:N6-adenosine-specific RNA methylase IME4
VSVTPVKYKTIVADPPWPIHGDSKAPLRPWCSKGGRRARDTFFPYKIQTLEWIKALGVAALAESDAHLYLWVPASFNRQGIGVQVVQAWGFSVVSELVWDKINFGLGKFPRPQHEIVLICRRGNLPFQLNNVGSVQRWSRPYGMSHGFAGKIHSAKPEGFTDLVERASPAPYLELFARRQRLGWDSWGDEAFNHVSLSCGEPPSPAAVDPVGERVTD